MKQSERVKEATRWALDKLSRMSKEELDQRLAARELGPVGQLLLETGTIRALMDERAEKSIFVTVELILEDPDQHPAADNDVRYALAADVPWTAVKSENQSVVVSGKTGPGVEQWLIAA